MDVQAGSPSNYCYFHPDDVAHALCVRCGNFICEQCITRDADRRCYCKQCYVKAHQRKKKTPQEDTGLPVGPKLAILFGNLCMTPFLGVVVYLLWREERPKSARQVCWLTWIPLVVMLGLVLLLVVLSAVRGA